MASPQSAGEQVPDRAEQAPSVEPPQSRDDRSQTAENDHRSSRASSSREPPSPSPSEEGSDATEEGQIRSPEHEAPTQLKAAEPPLPNEPLPDAAADSAAPPLPAEPAPDPADDGWEYHWVPSSGSYWFYNRFTGVWQQENPRVPEASTADAAPQASASAATAAAAAAPVAGGYNPAIHGDYDPNAWYAQGGVDPAATAAAASDATASAPDPETLALYIAEGADTGAAAATAGFFNRRTGQWQPPELGPERHADEAKARRQMNAFFDVDAAANAYEGRSLRAERAARKPSKAELRAFKERRRARKEEKRRAWLRD